MTEEKEKGAGHPLDQQNAIERAIQLEGNLDPDNFKFPDGRTLSEVRQANQEAQAAEYQKEIQMVASRTREQSAAEFQKGKSQVVDAAGNIIDNTEPVKSDVTITLAKSRTTMADIEAGSIKAPRERVSEPAPTESSQ